MQAAQVQDGMKRILEGMEAIEALAVDARSEQTQGPEGTPTNVDRAQAVKLAPILRDIHEQFVKIHGTIASLEEKIKVADEKIGHHQMNTAAIAFNAAHAVLDDSPLMPLHDVRTGLPIPKLFDTLAHCDHFELKRLTLLLEALGQTAPRSVAKARSQFRAAIGVVR